MSDQDLIQGLKQDDPDSNESLWRMLFKMASAFARYRNIDEDLARDSVVEAYSRIINKGIYQYKFECPFTGYCRRILVNEIYRLLKAGGKEPFADELGDELGSDPGMEDLAPRTSWDVIQQRIQRCMDKLPDQEREVLKLLYFEGLSPQQGAERLRVTRNNVNQLAYRGRKKMKECLSSNGFHTEGDVLGL